jgi:hypothetical protein
MRAGIRKKALTRSEQMSINGVSCTLSFLKQSILGAPAGAAASQVLVKYAPQNSASIKNEKKFLHSISTCPPQSRRRRIL